MSSSDRIPIHENCCLSIRVVKVTKGYFYSLVMKISTLITPFGLFCSASLYMIISHFMCLISRSQTKQTLTKSTLQ